jgi:hypothetical protein
MYDFIYNGILLSSLYFTCDLLNKYKKKEINNRNDVQMYFILKGVTLLNTYNYTKKSIETIITKCKKKDDIEDDVYKVVVLTNNNDILKCLLCYDEDSYYFEGIECFDDAKLIFVTNVNNEKFLQIKAEELKEPNQLKNKLENMKYEKIFLNVQLTINEKEYDLNEIVEKYYVSGNIILDIDFVKYMLQEYFDFDLEDEDYKINIIDKNVTMIEIDMKSSIQITDEGYTIITEQIKEQ